MRTSEVSMQLSPCEYAQFTHVIMLNSRDYAELM